MQVEPLEIRILPTVTATMSKGELRLTGDAGPNDVMITQTGNSIQVTGRNGTTVKVGGSESGSATFNGVTSLRATMKASNDTIQLGDGLVLKNVTLGLGAGANTVLIGQSQITGKLAITGGAGADSIGLTRSVIGNATINTSSGDDRVTLAAVSANGIITVNTGNGADLVETIMATPGNGGGPGDGGGGIPGVGGLGGLTVLSDLVQFVQTTTDLNLGEVVNSLQLEQLNNLIDLEGVLDLTAIRDLAEQIDIDQILFPDGSLNLLGLLNLGNLVDLSSLDTGLLGDLTSIIDIGDLTDAEFELLQNLITFLAEFDLDDLIGGDDLDDPTQPGGLGSSLTASLNINTGSGDDVVSLGNARFGTVSILTGNDRDRVTLSTVAIDRTLRINTGSADDIITINGLQQNGSGSSLIDGSSGIDRVSVTTSLFNGGATISGGSSAGNQIVIDDVSFKSFATLNGLGIGDSIKIEQDPLRSGSTVFSQPVKVILGGAAEMSVSLNQPTTKTQFLSTVSVTGKSPRGKLKVATGKTTFASTVSLKNVDYTMI